MTQPGYKHDRNDKLGQGLRWGLDALTKEVGTPTLSLNLSGLSTLVLDEARENVAIAERAVAALRLHLESGQS